MIALAAHERIVAVKDAKGDLAASSRVIAETDLAYYAGDDAMTLPLLAVGGVGVVGTSTHFSGRAHGRLIRAYEAGDVAQARAAHAALLPIYTGIFRTQGVILVEGRAGPAGPAGRRGAAAAGRCHRAPDQPSARPTSSRPACPPLR